MQPASTCRRLLLHVGASVAALPLWAAGAVDVSITPALREYCHTIRFPKGWGAIEPISNDSFPPIWGYEGQYEFRVPSLLETRFLVRGLEPGTKHYTANVYEVDLSDARAIARSVTEQAWDSGTPVPITRNEAIPFYPLKNDQTFGFRGLQLVKTGSMWGRQLSRMSPDQTWLVLLSASGKAASTEDLPLGHVSGTSRGNLFYDVFNADTGKKVLTIRAAYNGIDPGQALIQAAWVTERYFIVPLGDHRERCLVCDFGRGTAQRDGAK
jgi:hypothetical protein